MLCLNFFQTSRPAGLTAAQRKEKEKELADAAAAAVLLGRKVKDVRSKLKAAQKAADLATTQSEKDKALAAAASWSSALKAAQKRSASAKSDVSRIAKSLVRLEMKKGKGKKI